MRIHLAGQGQGQVFPVAVVGRGDNRGAARLQQGKEGGGITPGEVDVFDHFQAGHHREPPVARDQVVIGRTLFKPEFRIVGVGLGDTLGGRIHPGDIPAQPRQGTGHTAIAAAEFKHSPPPPVTGASALSRAISANTVGRR